MSAFPHTCFAEPELVRRSRPSWIHAPVEGSMPDVKATQPCMVMCQSAGGNASGNDSGISPCCECVAALAGMVQAIRVSGAEAPTAGPVHSFRLNAPGATASTVRKIRQELAGRLSPAASRRKAVALFALGSATGIAAALLLGSIPSVQQLRKGLASRFLPVGCGDTTVAEAGGRASPAGGGRR